MDRFSGSIFSTVSRPQDTGSKVTYLTLDVFDGIDSSQVDVVIRWANSEEPDTLPHENAFIAPSDKPSYQEMAFMQLWPDILTFDGVA